jgi:hypothetical protein
MSTVAVAQVQKGSFAGTIEREALPRLRSGRR